MNFGPLHQQAWHYQIYQDYSDFLLDFLFTFQPGFDDQRVVELITQTV